MYVNNKTGCFAIGGSKDNGTYKEIGDKRTPLLEFSLAVGKDEHGNITWFNCKAWNPIASRFRGRIFKGEKYLVSGTWEKREHNGKDYYTLVVDFIADMIMAEVTTINTELNIDDDLPDFMK